MDKLTKAIILLIGVGILFNILKKTFFATQKQEIIVNGHHVDKAPCMYAINELFGRGIDSSKMCDCLIPKFYELVKHDPSKSKKFKEMGFFQLEGEGNDSLSRLFANCASQNIADSTFRLDLEKFKEPLLKRLKDSLAVYTEFQSYNIDSLANCLLQNLNGKLTINEYFGNDFIQFEKISNIIMLCIVQNPGK